jgi:hypothetical protein
VPVSHIRNRYLLSEAFELIGRRLFDDEWKANELQAMPCPSPDELRADHEHWKKARDEIDGEIEKVRDQIRKRLLSETEAARLNKQIEELQTKRHDIAVRLLSHPEPTDTHVHSYEAYQRRRTAERTLVDAIKSGKFPVWGRQMAIETYLWGEPHFHYDIELSIVRVPRTFSSKRHQAARIDELAFDSWLATLKPLTASAMPPKSPEDRCALFLRTEVAEGEKRMTRDEYREYAMNEFPGLTGEGFRRVWDAVVPESWKQAGRPPAKNR